MGRNRRDGKRRIIMKNYAKHIYFNEPRQNAPQFVIGSISVKVAEFIEWAQSVGWSDKGYINLDVLRSKDGKPYVAVNDYKSGQKTERKPVKQRMDPKTEFIDGQPIIDIDEDNINPEDLPF